MKADLEVGVAEVVTWDVDGLQANLVTVTNGTDPEGRIGPIKVCRDARELTDKVPVTDDVAREVY